MASADQQLGTQALGELLEVRNRLPQVCLQFRALEEQVAELRGREGSQMSELQARESAESIKALEKRVEELQSRETFQARERQAREAARALELQEAQSEAARQKHEASLALARQQTAEDRAEHLEAELREAWDRAQDLEEDLHRKGDQLSKIWSQLKDREGELDRLDEQLDIRDAELELASDESKRLQEQIKKLEAESAGLKQRIAELTDAARVVEGVSADARGELAAYKLSEEDRLEAAKEAWLKSKEFTDQFLERTAGMLQSGFEGALRQLQAAGVDLPDEVLDKLDPQEVWKALPAAARTASAIIKGPSAGTGKGKKKK